MLGNCHFNGKKKNNNIHCFRGKIKVSKNGIFERFYFGFSNQANLNYKNKTEEQHYVTAHRKLAHQEEVLNSEAKYSHSCKFKNRDIFWL